MNPKIFLTPVIQLAKRKVACDLILKRKQNDNPVSDIVKAKRIYEETRDAGKACGEFSENENTCVEHKLLIGLSKVNKNDYVTALESVPRNIRLLYIHSFQGLIWNKIVSIRIKEFGLKPIVGDLVFDKDTNEDLSLSADNDIIDKNEDTEDTEVIKNDSGEVIEEPKNKCSVKILTETDLENYTIYDIILPLPGYDIIYPENKMREHYKELLESYGLSLEMPKQRVKTYTLSGTYRRILLNIEDLSWKIVKYNNPYDTLIRSDFEEFLGKAEPKIDEDGAYKALVIEFSLKPSSYATMVVREILKTDTSTNAHAKLNDYHQGGDKSKDTGDVAGSHTVPIDGLAPDSLLTNKEKYEEFKKSIFGDSSELKRKSDEESQEVSNKKVKTDVE